jgi:basic membrane lipoprotein Med (substrate-binding protein (PBP1-ABC) superfamily)
MKRANPPAERIELACYDGTTHLGNLIDQGCKVVAETVDGEALGVFASRQAATHAILAHHRASGEK